MTIRRTGDTISGDLVRRVRERAGMTQDEFAERLGFRSGKNVISAWETGRSRCEGPAAELVLLLYGGEQITGIQHAQLSPEERALYEQVANGDRYTRTKVLVSP